MIRLEFSETDITALEYERYHHPHPHVQRKMEVLYLKSQGLSHQDIRQLCRISSKTTLVTYLREYEAGGIAALKQLNYKGSPSQLNEHIGSLKAAWFKNRRFWVTLAAQNRPPLSMAQPTN